jgi:hypothetical protein
MEWNLVDGHNRHTICTKHNLQFNVVEMPFDSRNDVCIWIIQNQLGRRNLPHFARAELGVKLKHFFQEKGLENKKTAGKLHGISDINSVKELSQNSAKPILDSCTNKDCFVRKVSETFVNQGYKLVTIPLFVDEYKNVIYFLNMKVA